MTSDQLYDEPTPRASWIEILVGLAITAICLVLV